MNTPMMAVAFGHVPIALLLVPFAPVIDPSAVPRILGSVVLHLGYQLLRIAAYRAGDLTLVYPVARGSAPISVTLVLIWILGMSFTQIELLGVLFIVLGLASLSLVRRGIAARNPHAVIMALCTSAFIAAWSMGSAHAKQRPPGAIGSGRQSGMRSPWRYGRL